MDARQLAIQQWLNTQGWPSDTPLAPASSDASFRRYFRVSAATGSYIVMDAPPDKEDAARFARIAHALRQLNLHVPQVLAADYQQGFLLLDDFGQQSYLAALTEHTVDALYGDALAALLQLQTADTAATGLSLPLYDDALLRSEMGLFREWFLFRHLDLKLQAHEQQMLHEMENILIASALAQPTAWVHRDYHSRNLMVTADRNPGILDFQDAVVGPLTYDIVSLLKDCYIAWPTERVESWAVGYYERLRAAGCLAGLNRVEFLRCFDLMGMQRHLKAIGIFARLHQRDGKSGYLADIPRTLHYVHTVAQRYRPAVALADFIETRILRKL